MPSPAGGAEGAQQPRAEVRPGSRSPSPARRGASRRGRSRHRLERPASAPASGRCASRPVRVAARRPRTRVSFERRARSSIAARYWSREAKSSDAKSVRSRSSASMRLTSSNHAGPFDVVDQPQAADDVAGRHVAATTASGARLRMISSASQPDCLELLLQPVQRLAGILRPVAQAVEKLRREGGVARMRRVRRAAPSRSSSSSGVASTRSATSLAIWRISPRAIHAHGDAAQILDQHEAQQRRQRPQFADLHRLDRLEAVDHRLERMAGDTGCRNARHRSRRAPARAAPSCRPAAS